MLSLNKIVLVGICVFGFTAFCKGYLQFYLMGMKFEFEVNKKILTVSIPEKWGPVR